MWKIFIRALLSSTLEHFDLPTYPGFTPKANIAPSSNILTIFKLQYAFEMGKVKWGIIPPWAKEGRFKQPRNKY